nr:phosphohistidine phosphatase SixA [Pseudomonas sp. R5(2019)]
MRHGEAEPQVRSDAERELTAHGREQVVRSAGHLLGQPLQAILVSPYVRAQQTAELVRQSLGLEQALQTVPWLRPDTRPEQVLTELSKLGLESALLISHQPLVSTLLSLLEEGHHQATRSMGTASLAELEGDVSVAGLMTLHSLRHP